jgi:hypothetical protein
MAEPLTPEENEMEYFTPLTRQVARQEHPALGRRRIVTAPSTPSLSTNSDRTPFEEIPALDLGSRMGSIV